MHGFQHLSFFAKVRVAGSNPVVRSLQGFCGQKLARCSHNRLLLMQVVMLYLRFKAPFQSFETT